VKCGDAIGKEYDYSVIMEQLRTSDWNRTGGLQWDDNTESPFFNTIHSDGTIMQFWFDSPESLRLKFQWAQQQGLGGVGPFTINNVNRHASIESEADADAMWSSFDSYFVKNPLTNDRDEISNYNKKLKMSNCRKLDVSTCVVPKMCTVCVAMKVDIQT
jgi:hypothetical protein